MQFPTIQVKKSAKQTTDVDEILAQIEQIEFEDLELVGYRSHKRLAMAMSV